MSLMRARQRGRTRPVQAVALGVVGAALSIAAFHFARLTDFDRITGVLELRAEWRARDMERKLEVTGQSAEALAVYLAAEGEMTAVRFHNFARLAHDRNDLDTALYWSPWVAGIDRASFVAAARHDVAPDYDIREFGPDNRFVPAAARQWYLPRLYEETFDHTPGISGFDLLSRPDGPALVGRVRDTGTPLASPALDLSAEGAHVPGFMILWPV